MFKRVFSRRFSSVRAKHFMDLESKYGCHNYAPIPVVIERGEGVNVWDVDGKKYIDCLAGYSAVNQGHCHPKILDAMEEQSKKLHLLSRTFLPAIIGTWEQYLCEMLGYDRVLLMSSGVEATEAAVKFARRWGVVAKGIDNEAVTILFASNNFWGRSLAACASSDDPERYYRFGPFENLGFDLIPFGDADALENAVRANPNIAAFIVEPIQGEAGVIIPPEGYLRRCREICDKYDILLGFDEIQTGFGRVGKLLACDWEGVRPDLLSLGKSLSGGFYPVSAMLANDKVMKLIKSGEHGSTWGGNPLACAIGKAAVEVIISEGMVENSLEKGNFLLKEFQKFKYPFITDIRGRGLMIGIE